MENDRNRLENKAPIHTSRRLAGRWLAAAVGVVSAAACSEVLGVHDAILGTSGSTTGTTTTSVGGTSSSTTSTGAVGGTGGTGGATSAGGTTSSSGGAAGSGGMITGGAGGSTTSSSSTGGTGGGACGNHILEQVEGEDCDDGNTDSGDGCSPSCRVESPLQIDAGQKHTCVLFANGTLKCWGENSSGQIGVGSNNYSIGDAPGEMGVDLKPVNLGMQAIIQHFAAANSYSCAFLGGGDVKCWGDNTNGRLGLGDTAPRGLTLASMGDMLPILDLGGKVLAVGTSGSHTCAIVPGGKLKCWGTNNSGQLGYGDTQDRGDMPGEIGALGPVPLGAGDVPVSVFTGGAFSCVLLLSNYVKCWGFNGTGQLGWDPPPASGSIGDDVDEMGDKLQVTVLSSATFDSVQTLSLGFEHACALSTTEAVKCWGGNSYGQLGQGHKNPVGDGMNDMALLANVDIPPAKAVAAGEAHTCALLMDGNVRCWGRNASGQLGLEDSLNRGDEPNEMGANLKNVNLGTGRTAVAITAGQDHTCAVLDNDKVKCWGNNAAGQLGLGSTTGQGATAGSMGDALMVLDLGQ